MLGNVEMTFVLQVIAGMLFGIGFGSIVRRWVMGDPAVLALLLGSFSIGGALARAWPRGYVSQGTIETILVEMVAAYCVPIGYALQMKAASQRKS